MQLGLVGLGRMGANMARRWLAAGHECVGYARDPPTSKRCVATAPLPRRRSRSSSRSCAPPRTMWIMIPAAAVDVRHRRARAAASSRRHRHRRRQLALRRRRTPRRRARGARRALPRRRRQRRHLRPRARLLPDDRRRAAAALRLTPLFAALAPGGAPRQPPRATPRRTATLHCGPPAPATSSRWSTTASSTASWPRTPKGSICSRKRTSGAAETRRRGDAPRSVHGAHLAYDFDLAAIAELWRHGSVVRSWLLDLDECGARSQPEARRLPGRRLRLRRRPLDRRTRPSKPACRCPCSRRRYSRASRRAATTTSRTACCRRCASSSAATWSVGAAPRKIAMRWRRTADALVLFGATGDLAHKKIFPALQDLVQHGTLDVPVIGVARAGSGVERLRERIRDSLEPSDDGLDAAAFAQLAKLLRYVDGDYREPKTFAALRKALGDAAHPLHYLALPPSLFATVADKLRESGCADGAQRRRRETVRPRSRFGARAQRRAASQLRRAIRLSHRSLPRQGVGAEPAVLPLRELVPRADLEPQLRRPRADHDGRERSASARAASSTRRSARFATSCRTICCRSSRISRWSRRWTPTPTRCSTRRSKVFKAIRTLRPTDLVRGQYRGYRERGRRRAGLERRDLRGAAPAPRFVALGRRAVLLARGQAPRRRRRPRCSSTLKRPPQHVFRGDRRAELPALSARSRPRRDRTRRRSRNSLAPR